MNTTSQPSSIFELVDSTADEYYTLGLFYSKEEALATATEGDHPPTDCEDLARLEIRERKIGFTGWGNNGKMIAEIQWEMALDKDDDWGWETPSVFLKDQTEPNP